MLNGKTPLKTILVSYKVKHTPYYETQKLKLSIFT